MIRAIHCAACIDAPQNGQHIVCGLALHPMRCDSCNAPIPTGEPARAITTLTDETEYKPWEHDFLFGTRHETLRGTK